MTATRDVQSDTVTVHVPFRIVKRGGRKEMQMPEGAAQRRGPDSTLVKTLARAFRWKRMLESGKFASAAELAVHEGIAPSYVGVSPSRAPSLKVRRQSIYKSRAPNLDHAAC
jgi:hypothetical protein